MLVECKSNMDILTLVIDIYILWLVGDAQPYK